MAVTHTASSSPAQGTGSATTPTHTFTSLINLPDTTGISLVGISIAAGSAQPSSAITNVTLGGATVTNFASILSNQSGGGNLGGIWLGRVFNSAIGSTGNKNLAVTMTGSIGSLIAGVVCLAGQDNTTPIGTPVTASGSTSNGQAAVTDSVSGDMVVGLGGRGGTITSMAQTERWRLNVDGNSGAGNAGMNTAAGAAGTVNVGMTAAAEWWAMVGVTVKQDSGGGGRKFILTRPA